MLLPDAADKTITALVSDAERSPAVRAYLGQVMQLKDKIGTKEPAKASVLTEASLRVERRERLKAVSDEPLIDLDDYTKAWVAKHR